MNNMANLAITPTLGRRLLSMFYDLLLLISLLLLAGFIFIGITHGRQTPIIRATYQTYLFGVIGAYYLWFWSHGGQTLPMKAWKIRLISAEGKALIPRQLFIRFLTAWLSLAGIGILWALIDRDRQFLHDRLANTRLVAIPRN